ncbi:sensor histidine kinase [Nocardiopsis aegyptia]|uniref:histidine kinase n=1 Tax=Nocardiopsis aegyptia TaxID=220378 RepID=A0A7Z0JB90_9ACTN|nr:histidine kinase [Nocardiopsis aegyptia]NYJ35567.1 signal transduction histidine kinase [Nocardiopsis aegyptia]
MYDLLRAVWDEPRPPRPPSSGWWDRALVAVLVVLALLEGVLRPDMPWRVLGVAVTAGLAPLLLWRRSHPLAVLVAAFAVSALVPLVTGGEATETYTIAYMLVLVYALFRWGSGREIVVGSLVVVAKAVLWGVLGYTAAADVLPGLAVLCAAGALGTALRYRAGSRERELERARMLERESVARDLHDTVAHHVSAVAIRAQAGLAVAESRPGAAVEALTVVESEASRALAEMRAMVRVLRRGRPADLEPSPGIGDLAALAGSAGSGPAVAVAVTGDVEGIAPSLGTAVYRLAQEAVTNARRHARGATRIDVRVEADDASVRLCVHDDGDTGPLRTAAPGYGLIGMAERADLLGGTCAAAPDPDGGWKVTAVLPRNGAGE